MTQFRPIERNIDILLPLPAGLNRSERRLGDADYVREASVTACEAAGIEPSTAVNRDERHPHWSERYGEAAAPPPEASPVERMKTKRITTVVGRAAYTLRKQTVGPVFGAMKSALGFCQAPHLGPG